MGWKRRGGPSKPVELVFRFASRRAFARLALFAAAGRPDLGVRVFGRAVVWVSDDGDADDAAGWWLVPQRAAH